MRPIVSEVVIERRDLQPSGERAEAVAGCTEGGGFRVASDDTLQLTRRRFMLGATSLLGSRCLACSASAVARAEPARVVPIELLGRAAHLGLERVRFGLPLPPGFLQDSRDLRVTIPSGREIPARVTPLEPWRAGVEGGSLRSVLLQLEVDLSKERRRVVEVRFGERRALAAPAPFAIGDTLIDPEGLDGPRVLSVLPAAWLCASLVAGPQVPAAWSGPYAAYDRFVERSFPGSLAFRDSSVASHWLFDRTTSWYKQYVRTGEPRFLEAAYQAANFVRRSTAMDGPDAGAFKLKGADLKYIYPQAMHLHYLLTGDERARRAGEAMARFCLNRWDPWYCPLRCRPRQPGADPGEQPFWSPRHQAYGFLGVLHGWELTGDPGYLRRADEYVDALAAHQENPGDGYPPDGSWRQDWAAYAPEESTLPAATSAWMTAILVAPMFHSWFSSGDPRVPLMVTRFCDFLDRRGFQPDGQRVYYVIDCIGTNHVAEAPEPQEQGMERHSTELAYLFAMGLFFSRSREQQRRFQRRFDAVFDLAVTIDANRPPRCFNWAFHASSQLMYLLRARRESIRTATGPVDSLFVLIHASKGCGCACASR